MVAVARIWVESVATAVRAEAAGAPQTLALLAVRVERAELPMEAQVKQMPTPALLVREAQTLAVVEVASGIMVLVGRAVLESSSFVT